MTESKKKRKRKKKFKNQKLGDEEYENDQPM